MGLVYIDNNVTEIQDDVFLTLQKSGTAGNTATDGFTNFLDAEFIRNTSHGLDFAGG